MDNEREFYNIREVALLLDCRVKNVPMYASALGWQTNDKGYYPVPDVQKEAKRRVGEKARLQSMGTIRMNAYSGRKDRREEKKRLRQKRQAEGLCQICGYQKEDTALSACNSCIEKSKEHRKTINGRMSHLRHEAKRKGVEITITPAELAQIEVPELCPLLGIPLINDGHTHFKPSYDRIDNTKGYIPGNIWIISALANLMKRDASIEELQTFAKNVLLHFPTT